MSRDGSLRIEFRKHLRDAMWSSIETGLTEGGVPDAHFIFPDGAEGWIEHKKTAAYAVVVKPLQVAWHSRYTRHGGRSFFAVRARKADLYLVRGEDAALLKSKGLRAVPHVGVWHGGPSRWNWDEIRWLLTQPSHPPLPQAV